MTVTATAPGFVRVVNATYDKPGRYVGPSRTPRGRAEASPSRCSCRYVSPGASREDVVDVKALLHPVVDIRVRSALTASRPRRARRRVDHAGAAPTPAHFATHPRRSADRREGFARTDVCVRTVEGLSAEREREGAIVTYLEYQPRRFFAARFQVVRHAAVRWHRIMLATTPALRIIRARSESRARRRQPALATRGRVEGGRRETRREARTPPPRAPCSAPSDERCRPLRSSPDVPPLCERRVRHGGAVCIAGFVLWRIESNKKAELAYWKQVNTERKEKEARETKEEAESEPASEEGGGGGCFFFQKHHATRGFRAAPPRLRAAATAREDGGRARAHARDRRRAREGTARQRHRDGRRGRSQSEAALPHPPQKPGREPGEAPGVGGDAGTSRRNSALAEAARACDRRRAWPWTRPRRSRSSRRRSLPCPRGT